MGNILVVAAHPDDEVLGMGATIAKLSRAKEQVHVIFLATGIYARRKDKDIMKGELKSLREHAENAGKIMGVEKENIFFEDFPDNAMDTVPLLDIVKKLENYVETVRPVRVFTHHYNDLNVDHRLSFQSAQIATRPIRNNIELISFEVPSCTEWSFPYSFKPNYFVDVSDTYKLKLKALKEYKNEIRNSPHPRSLKVLDAYMTKWGSIIGTNKAEAFEIIRKADYIWQR